MKQLTIAKQITNREVASLDKYLTEIGKLDLISAEVEVELANRIQQGDPIALERLTKANLRFVVSVAKQYQNRGLALSDMINEGNIGLIKAAQRFDEKRGFKFISYAVWWIRQSIMQALAESRIVRLPLNRIGSISKISKVLAELEQKFQREPSSEEVARAMDLNAAALTENLVLSVRHLSLDSPFQYDEEGSLLDTIPDDNAVSPDEVLMRESLRNEIAAALRTLTLRESEVLILYYGLNGNQPLTLDEIAVRFNVSRERIRQLKDKATLHLKSSHRSKRLLTYLG